MNYLGKKRIWPMMWLSRYSVCLACSWSCVWSPGNTPPSEIKNFLHMPGKACLWSSSAEWGSASVSNIWEVQVHYFSPQIWSFFFLVLFVFGHLFLGQLCSWVISNSPLSYFCLHYWQNLVLYPLWCSSLSGIFVPLGSEPPSPWPPVASLWPRLVGSLFQHS